MLRFCLDLLSLTSVVIVNITIPEHLGVFPGLPFVNLRFILTGDAHPPGRNSESVEIEHLNNNLSPDIQFLNQLGLLLGQLHDSLHRPP